VNHQPQIFHQFLAPVRDNVERQLGAIRQAAAEKERAMISRRTTDALAAKKAQGVTLGGLRAYGAQARDDAMERAEQLRLVLDELAGASARKIAAVLNKRKIATPTGRVWYAATVIRVQKRLGLA
jgi:DNA invertase Pin-like site-specific DNA recombinase